VTTTGSGLTHLFHYHTSPQRCILFVPPLGTAIPLMSGPVRLSVSYITPDIDRRYEYEEGIRKTFLVYGPLLFIL